MKLSKSPRLILSLVCSALVLASCGPQPVNPGQSQETTSETHTDEEGNIIYADFSSWAPDFQLIRVPRNAGAIYVNKDPQYTKEGKGQSCLFRPIGGYSSGSDATFLFPTQSKSFDFDYRDFKQTKALSFDFYNAEDHDVKVAVGLTPTVKTIDIYTKTETVWQTLPSKQWTTIKYEVKHTQLSFLYDVSLIEGFYVSFPNLGSRDEEDAPHIYLDTILIEKHLVAPPLGEGLNLGEMEFLDFEDEKQKEAITTDGPTSCKPKGDIVKASDYNLKAPSGENVYRWNLTGGNRSDGLTWSWLIFSDLVTQSSIFGRSSLEDAKELVVTFDVYNDNDEVRYLEFDFLYYEMAIFNSLELQPKTWMTFSFSMRPVLETFDGFQKVGKLRFVYPEYIDTVDYIFFIDNMHFNWASDSLPGQITKEGK